MNLIHTDDVVFQIISTDGVKFDVPKTLAQQSIMIRTALECDPEATSIKVGVSSTTLSKVVSWLNINVGVTEARIPQPIPNDNLTLFMDAKNVCFFKALTISELKHLLVASDFLHIQPLLDMGSATIAAIIKHKNMDIDEIKKLHLEYNDIIVSDLL